MGCPAVPERSPAHLTDHARSVGAAHTGPHGGVAVGRPRDPDQQTIELSRGRHTGKDTMAGEVRAHTDAAPQPCRGTDRLHHSAGDEKPKPGSSRNETNQRRHSLQSFKFQDHTKLIISLEAMRQGRKISSSVGAGDQLESGDCW